MQHDSKHIFFDYISTIPLWIYGGLTYQSLLHRETKYIFFALYILVADTLVYLIKHIPYPENSYLYKITRRPEGAKQCDYLSRNNMYTNKSPGFPSGHMTTTTLFCVSQMLKAYSTQIKQNTSYIYGIHVTIIILMGLARYYKKCHSILQILSGCVLGGVMAWLYHLYGNYT